jgi:hypothetical protein
MQAAKQSMTVFYFANNVLPQLKNLYNCQRILRRATEGCKRGIEVCDIGHTVLLGN